MAEHKATKQRWAVARPSVHDELGLLVVSWHRWRWQAARALPGFLVHGPYGVYSAKQVDEAWNRADRLGELRREERARRYGMARLGEALQGGSEDLDGRA